MGLRREEARHALGVAHVALHAHRQRFQPQGVEKRVEGGQRRAQIAQRLARSFMR